MKCCNTRCLSILWIVFFFSCSQGSVKAWCYEGPKCGPSTWGPAICQTGKIQSPINLPYNGITVTRTADLYQSSCYSEEHDFNVKNNGHTVQATLQGDLSSTCTLEGSLVKGQYIFSQVHFHWGSEDSKGSEHTINMKKYPIEAHLVHYSSDYDSFDEAKNSSKTGSLAVVGVMFNVGGKDNPSLTPIVNSMQNVKKFNTTATGSKLALSSFLSKSSFKYVDVIQYSGSLTTPECNQNVLWNVFAKPLQISAKQMKVFRTMEKDSEGNRLVNNYRPIQEQNNRDITVLRSSVQ